MKPAERTISYTVYSPNYVPGKCAYERVENFKKAKKLAFSWGVGSEIVRIVYKLNRKGYGGWKYIENFIYEGKK